MPSHTCRSLIKKTSVQNSAANTAATAALKYSKLPISSQHHDIIGGGPERCSNKNNINNNNNNNYGNESEDFGNRISNESSGLKCIDQLSDDEQDLVSGEAPSISSAGIISLVQKQQELNEEAEKVSGNLKQTKLVCIAGIGSASNQI